jgi:hypothetical protein
VDLKSFEGVAGLYLSLQDVAAANTGAATITVTTSPNGTNGWVNLTNYSLATATTVIYTNYWGTTNSQYTLATNNYLVPGVLSNAVPSLNGFAGQFYVQNPFTNYGAVCAGVTNANYLVGFQVNDQQRYLQVVWAITGTSTTWAGSTVLVGRRSNPRYY